LREWLNESSVLVPAEWRYGMKLALSWVDVQKLEVPRSLSD
jgi:hypothetical protein